MSVFQGITNFLRHFGASLVQEADASTHILDLDALLRHQKLGVLLRFKNQAAIRAL